VPLFAVFWPVSVLFILILVPSAWSLPQFDIQFGSGIFPAEDGHGHDHHDKKKQLDTYDCRACHVNPTGGGMRNAHGRQFAVEHLPMMGKTHESEEAAAAAQVNPYLAFGTDIRFAYLRSQDEATSRFENSFFPMQGDFYLAFTPTDYLTLYYQDGVEASGSRETFGLFHHPRYNGHLKAGRFTPPFGLKLDDHSAFIREKLGFGPDDAFGQDAGIEIGFGGMYLFANAAVFNGGPFGGPGAADNNNDKGFSATGGIKLDRFWLAGSFYDNDDDLDHKSYAGGYAAFHIWIISLLAEWDYFKVEDLVGDVENTGSVLFTEANVHLLRGANAVLRYERCEDDDATVCIDDTDLERLTFGVTVYPTPFTEIIVQFRKNMEDTEIDNDRFLAMLHLYY
jgi:hypothetical protein